MSHLLWFAKTFFGFSLDPFFMLKIMFMEFFMIPEKPEQF